VPSFPLDRLHPNLFVHIEEIFSDRVGEAIHEFIETGLVWSNFRKVLACEEEPLFSEIVQLRESCQKKDFLP
jgi:hypothetical protein